MPAEAEGIESQAAELPVGARNGTPDRHLLSTPRSASLVVVEEETCPQLGRLEAEVVVMEGLMLRKPQRSQGFTPGGENMQDGFLQHLGESWPSQALPYEKQAQRVERL